MVPRLPYHNNRCLSRVCVPPPHPCPLSPIRPTQKSRFPGHPLTGSQIYKSPRPPSRRAVSGCEGGKVTGFRVSGCQDGKVSGEECLSVRFQVLSEEGGRPRETRGRLRSDIEGRTRNLSKNLPPSSSHGEATPREVTRPTAEIPLPSSSPCPYLRGSKLFSPLRLSASAGEHFSFPYPFQ